MSGMNPVSSVASRAGVNTGPGALTSETPPIGPSGPGGVRHERRTDPMKFNRTNSLLATALVATTLLVTACAKVPQAELDAAQAALDKARAAEAEKYAADTWRAASDSLAAA